MIARSWWRSVFTTSRSLRTMPSIMIAGSLSFRNSSAMVTRTFCVLRSSGPFFLYCAWNFA